MEQAQKPFSPKPIDKRSLGHSRCTRLDRNRSCKCSLSFQVGREEKMLANKNVENRVSSDPIQLCWCYFYNSLIRFGNVARKNFDLAKKIRLTVDARRAMIATIERKKVQAFGVGTVRFLPHWHTFLHHRARTLRSTVAFSMPIGLCSSSSSHNTMFPLRVSLCLRNSSLCSVDSRAVIMSKENKSFCSFALASLQVLIRISFLRPLPFLFFALGLYQAKGSSLSAKKAVSVVFIVFA